MRIPNYGYDFTLPYEKGRITPTVGNRSVSESANKYNAVINFDEESMSPYFYYTDESGLEHTVWFEDVRSIKAKYLIIKKFNLFVSGYWNLMRCFTYDFSFLNNFTFIQRNL